MNQQYQPCPCGSAFQTTGDVCPACDPDQPNGAEALVAWFVNEWEETCVAELSRARVSTRDAAQLAVAALLYLKAKRYLAPDPRDAPSTSAHD